MSTTDLQHSLKSITETLPPDMSLFWDLIRDMQEYCPEIWEKRQKGKTVKAERLAFVSEMTGRKIGSFNELWGAELYEIDKWFYENLQPYIDWCNENAEKIKGSINAEN